MSGPVRTYVDSTTIFTRGTRFVGHAECPSCRVPKMGITYGGELMNGTKIYEIAAHSPGRRAVVGGEPRCKGVGHRMQLHDEDGWQPVAAPALAVVPEEVTP